jgi:prenyltransferase beta subunit
VLRICDPSFRVVLAQTKGTLRMNRLVATTVTVFGLLGTVAEAVRAEVTAEQVQTAIDRGANYLLAQQRNDGSWPDYDGDSNSNYSGGVSALCTLALLNVGVDLDRKEMQKALRHLRTIQPTATYVASLQTMVFARAKAEKDRVLIDRNVQWLQRAQIAAGKYKGAWTYHVPSNSSGDGDNSNSQFALLALHEAERAGVSASNQTWQLAEKYWEKCQNADGSWGYTKFNSKGSGSMTCAGITSLVIAADKVQSRDAQVTGNHIECCVAHRPGDTDRIERAIQWLGRNYSVTSNPGSSGEWGKLYYLYGLERAGRLTARRFLPLPSRPGQPSRADWYREGAERLIGSQDRLSGFWRTRGDGGNNPLVGTSFALLFLSKGRWPVLLGKLQFGSGDDWNHHRQDVGNLTRYVETRWRRDLTWQAIDLRLASVDDLIQTPVLYLCGSQSPLPEELAERKDLARKLRDYLDRGGFLMAEADCGCGDFDKGFRSLMREVFPEPEYKLRLLEPEHPIWCAEEKIDPRHLRPLLGIEFGCRTSVVYALPENPRPSLSCLWELSRAGRGVKYNDAVQVQVDAALSLGINVLAYATNRELKTKESFFPPATLRRVGDQLERGRLDVANLRHPGSCNVAPRALVNLMDTAGRQLKLRTHVRDAPLDITDPSLFDYHLVFMHGRTAFRLTDGERRQLRQYIDRGGMLLADSLCASRAFTESFRQEMAAIFPNCKLEQIPASDPLLGTAYGGLDLRTVSRRTPKATGGAGPLETTVHKVPPELEGIKLGDRWGVVFSPYDLSCALEKQDSLGCSGYTQVDAARIGLNVVLYSLQQ